jgi:flagellar motor switch/type III secretory pathway protein FliN
MITSMLRRESISKYPWGSLNQMSRSSARAWGALQRMFSNASFTTKLTEALGRWLGEPVHVEQLDLTAMPDRRQGSAEYLRFRVAAGRAEISWCPDARLVARLVSFALNREVSLVNPLSPVEPEILGAVAAIVAKIVEDSGLDLDVQFADDCLEIPDARRVRLNATLHIGSAAYPLVFGIALQLLAPAELPADRIRLAALGALPLELSLVVGKSTVARDELCRLAPGTAFLTGAGLWVNDALVGHAVMIAPGAERGLRVQLQPGGKIVLGDSPVTLNHDDPNPTRVLDGETSDLTDTLFDAPVVLRVELGTVSLSAREWAGLRTGDVIETRQSLGAEVTLRVAGQALAKGELLNIEGELGVRITKLLVGE